MPDPDLLSVFIAPLEHVGIPYMVSGSVASALYGEPRATFDVAIVLGASKLPLLAEAFPESDFYLPPADVIAIEIARPTEGHFNVIHHDSGLKADFYPSLFCLGTVSSAPRRNPSRCRRLLPAGIRNPSKTRILARRRRGKTLP